ncbi:hypothetical protein G5B37_14690 [Rasiella rasia]|uniref:Uncharacterized protein n=1 Tax=Rasiella rasia TaxID=2744027 RepID=A0A6G6GQE1_9FLAO|nr:hypothetical protein [Rasiella rasia]QIE60757.1 hypothetical protein G5B37_14690 [Rasiella rasia]
MGFGGSVAAMLASIKANNAQLARRKANYRDSKSYGSVTYGKLEDHTKMSPTEFTAFKEKLAKEKRAESRKTMVLIAISVPAAIGLIYLLGYIIAGQL